MFLNKNHLPILKLSLSFIIPFMALMIIIPKYFAVEQNDTLTGLFALTALILMGIYQLYRKIGHQGNSPMFLGGAMMVLAVVPLIASISIQGSQQLIELDARTQGFALIGFVIGMIILIGGMKQALSASYFWGRAGR